jgi:hypothetical protein
MRPFVLIAQLVLLGLSLAAGDRPAPPRAPEVALSKTPDAATTKSIEDFAAYVFGQIESGPDEAIRDARKLATDLLTSKDCTLVFYNAFFHASDGLITRIAQAGNGYRTTNALYVLRYTRCPDAIALMVTQCDAKKQKLDAVRIAAGSMLTAMLGSRDAAQSDADGIAREIARVVNDETSALAATRFTEALATLVSTTDTAKMAPQSRNALMLLIRAGRATAVRAGEPGREDFVGAAFRALIGIRDQYVKMPKAAQDELASDKDLDGLLQAVLSLRFPESGKTADAARELAGARAVADALKQMIAKTKPAPAKK